MFSSISTTVLAFTSNIISGLSLPPEPLPVTLNTNAPLRWLILPKVLAKAGLNVRLAVLPTPPKTIP